MRHTTRGPEPKRASGPVAGDYCGEAQSHHELHTALDVSVEIGLTGRKLYCRVDQ